MKTTIVKIEQKAIEAGSGGVGGGDAAAASPQTTKLVVTMNQGGTEVVEEFDTVLYATGRTADTGWAQPFRGAWAQPRPTDGKA